MPAYKMYFMYILHVYIYIGIHRCVDYKCMSLYILIHKHTHHSRSRQKRNHLSPRNAEFCVLPLATDTVVSWICKMSKDVCLRWYIHNKLSVSPHRTIMFLYFISEIKCMICIPLGDSSNVIIKLTLSSLKTLNRFTLMFGQIVFFQ